MHSDTIQEEPILDELDKTPLQKEDELQKKYLEAKLATKKAKDD